jgi:uncharacterized protein YjiS (DUF1127 family)
MRKTIADVVLAVAAVRTRRQTRRNARMFQHISDAQLADIGLKRSDIGTFINGWSIIRRSRLEVRPSAYRARTARPFRSVKDVWPD